jgi:hypothetical protein
VLAGAGARVLDEAGRVVPVVSVEGEAWRVVEVTDVNEVAKVLGMGKMERLMRSAVPPGAVVTVTLPDEALPLLEFPVPGGHRSVAVEVWGESAPPALPAPPAGETAGETTDVIEPVGAGKDATDG